MDSTICLFWSEQCFIVFIESEKYAGEEWILQVLKQMMLQIVYQTDGAPIILRTEQVFWRMGRLLNMLPPIPVRIWWIGRIIGPWQVVFIILFSIERVCRFCKQTMNCIPILSSNGIDLKHLISALPLVSKWKSVIFQCLLYLLDDYQRAYNKFDNMFILKWAMFYCI